MDLSTEIKLLQDTIAGRAKPVLSPIGTLGRLAELYLQMPEPSRYSELARRVACEAIELATETHPLYQRLKHIEAMAKRLSSSPEPGALGMDGSAAQADREAFERSIKSAPRDAQWIADDWGNWAWERLLWEEAAEAYSRAGRALRRYVKLHVPDTEERLKVVYGTAYATRAAYAYVQIAKLKEALLELERSGGVEFGIQEDARLIDRLHTEHPEVAARFDASRRPIDGEGFAVDELGQFAADVVAIDDALDSLVREIRQLDGYRHFGLPTEWSEITEAAAKAPIIYLALTDKGTSLIAIKQEENDKTSIVSTTLQLTDSDLLKAATPFFTAELDQGTDDRMDTLMSLQQWLGIHLDYPIWQALEKLKRAGQPFVLVPTGLLSSMPIHAGFVPKSKNGGIQYPFHPKDVTYCYWARGLARSRSRRTERVTDGALVISNPKPLPVEFDPLGMASFESAAVLKHVSGVELEGMDADTQQVCTALPKAKLAHFCCHGSADRDLGYTGILMLANSEILNFGQLRRLSIAARLIVLSACRTGIAAVGVDHVLSLPAMFLASGACGVIGTFWHTDDMATFLLMLRFYSLWCDGGLEPDVALGEAQAWLMSSTAESLRSALPPGALEQPPAAMLKSTPDDAIPYQHPWFWSSFFFAGA